MDLTFFGVRGSCPCAGEKCGRIGGNTSCTLVSVDGEPPLALDLGSGLRALGDRLALSGGQVRMHALLTHLHFDHLLGLPFFAPLHEPGTSLRLFGPAQDREHLRDALACAVGPPFFPVPMVELGAEIEVDELARGESSATLTLGSISVRAARVPHPGSTLGFRLCAKCRCVVYIPDHQAPPDCRFVPDDRDLDELLAHARHHPDAERLDEVSLAIEGATVQV